MFYISCTLFVISVSFFVAAYVRYRRIVAEERGLLIWSEHLKDYDCRIQAAREYALNKSRAFDKAVAEYAKANNVRVEFNSIYSSDFATNAVQCRILSL